MDSLGPYGLLTIAVGIAALFVAVAAIPVLVVRNLVTRRPAATHLKEWLLYVLGAALLIITFVAFFLYGKHNGLDEYKTVKWMNILITAAIVFGYAAKRFWLWRRKWTFWAALCVLAIGHFALLPRLHWQQAGYFWLPVVVGLPELVLVVFVLEWVFEPHAAAVKRTNLEVANIIEAFVDGTGSTWDWDCFCSLKIENDDLDTIRATCTNLPFTHPPSTGSGYCNEAGIQLLRGMAKDLRELPENVVNSRLTA